MWIVHCYMKLWWALFCPESVCMHAATQTPVVQTVFVVYVSPCVCLSTHSLCFCMCATGGELKRAASGTKADVMCFTNKGWALCLNSGHFYTNPFSLLLSALLLPSSSSSSFSSHYYSCSASCRPTAGWIPHDASSVYLSQSPRLAHDSEPLHGQLLCFWLQRE